MPPREANGGRNGGRDGAIDKRRLILDAAMRVFARRGFHACRVSEIADEAGVAYGLVYHYFRSKDEILNTLFHERWQLLIDAIAGTDLRTDLSARDKLAEVAAFIIESYRREPDLMKVIIVEVTRAANTFGRRHLPHIQEAYEGISRIVDGGRRDGEFRADVSSEWAAMCFYGAVEQLLSGWIFDILPHAEADYDRAKALVVETICGGIQVARPAAAAPVSG